MGALSSVEGLGGGYSVLDLFNCWNDVIIFLIFLCFITNYLKFCFVLVEMVNMKRMRKKRKRTLEMKMMCWVMMLSRSM